MAWLSGLLVSSLIGLAAGRAVVRRTMATSQRETLAKALKRINSDDIQRQTCQIDAGNTYASFADIIYVQFNVASAQECSVLCSIDGMTGQGNNKLCKSFTYNKLTRECNFQGSSTPALHKHSCCDSGMPCTLDGIRQDIQEAYQAEFVQALQAEKDLGEKLAQTNRLLLEEQTKEHTVSVELEKLSDYKAEQHKTTAVELKKHEDIKKAPAFLPTHHKDAKSVEHKQVTQAAVVSVSTKKVEKKASPALERKTVVKTAVPPTKVEKKATPAVERKKVDHATQTVFVKKPTPAEKQAPPAKKTVAVAAKGMVTTKKETASMQLKAKKQWPYAPMSPYAQPPAVYPPPMQPAYAAPAQPVYAPPMQPAYTAPMQPAYTAPMQPAYTAPMQPAYTAPVQPAYAPPMQPAYTAPRQPAYPAPARAVPMPAARPAAQATPAVPTAHATKPKAPAKKEESSGMGWLLHMFIVMCFVFIVAGVVSGWSLKRREASRDAGRYSVRS